MKKFIAKIACFCAVFIGTSCFSAEVPTVKNEDIPTVKATFLLEHEGFLIWYAEKQGWNKKLGFNLELSLNKYNGLAILNQYRNETNAWDICCTGFVPFIMSGKDVNVEVIAVANNESAANSLVVHSDSDILKVKGYNKYFPEVYGSPETIKGKTFAVKGLSSGVFTLARWLDIFGLELSDIKLVNLTHSDIIDDLKKNQYSGAALWSPNLNDAIAMGYKEVVTAEQLGEALPCTIKVDEKFGNSNPELVAKFLAMYFKAVQVQVDNIESLVDEYQNFYKQYIGMEYSKAECLEDLKKHRVTPLNEQIELFKHNGNRRSWIQNLERDLTSNTLLMLKSMDSKDIQISNRIKSQKYINNTYIEMTKKYFDELNSL